MRMPIIGFETVVCIGCCCCANLAQADPLTFQFAGTINFVHDSLNLDDSVYVGVAFSGTYTFNPTGVNDYFPSDPSVGLYQFPAGTMTAHIGNYDFMTRNLGILIWNDTLSGDLYQPASITPFEAGGLQWSIMSLPLADESGTALQSDALPLWAPDLSVFSTVAGFALYVPGDELGIRGRLTSLTPEPGSLALLALGAVCFCRRRVR